MVPLRVAGGFAVVEEASGVVGVGAIAGVGVHSGAMGGIGV